MTYDEIMEARFAAGERFKKAIGRAIWFPDKVKRQTANEWVSRVAAIARRKPLPCSITPAEVESEEARPAQMIDALIQRGELTRTQLATLTGQSPNSGSYANNLSKLNSNRLLEKNGDKFRLAAL